MDEGERREGKVKFFWMILMAEVYDVVRLSSPYINHFLQPDSVVTGGPQGLNRYSYTHNNPVRYNDPSGHTVDCSPYDTACKNATSPSPDSILKKYNVTISGFLTEKTKWAVVESVIIVAYRIADERAGNESAKEAFNAVFDEGINFVWDGHCDGCRGGTIEGTNRPCGNNFTSPGCVPGGGFTAGNTITFASMSGANVNNMFRMMQNAVHELGHAYYNAIDTPLLGASLSRNALLSNSCERCYEWQQHPPSMNVGNADIPTELFADTFLAWSYDAWNNNPDYALSVENAQNAMDSFARSTR